MDYTFFAFLSIILLSTQLLGRISKRIKLPAVIGVLISGILLGPSLLNWVKLDTTSGGFVTMAAEIGVVLLMFTAGLETDLGELRSNLIPSLVVAFFGIITPLVGGTIAGLCFFPGQPDNYWEILRMVFIGVVLTATSVSVTVEVLRETGKLKGKVATTILGAAVIDDILGVIVLSVITGLSSPGVKVSTVFLQLLCFGLSVAVIWGIIAFLKKRGMLHRESPAAVVCSLALCFLMAWMAEDLYGIADVTGAYFAGLMLSGLRNASYLEKQTKGPLDLFFSPIFFASIGLKMTLGGIEASLWSFAVILLLVAVASKVIGCGLGAKLCRYNVRDSLRIGVGMMARGEVALIMAQKGLASGLLDESMFSLLVLVVFITTLAAPVLMVPVMRGRQKAGVPVIEEKKL